nr:MAG TPA: hypothetical protein [Caudoviricetes sp.]DAX82763.1 MAG TPA: hypothetical protein [Caudoviricetes sp.]
MRTGTALSVQLVREYIIHCTIQHTLMCENYLKPAAASSESERRR